MTLEEQVMMLEKQSGSPCTCVKTGTWTFYIVPISGEYYSESIDIVPIIQASFAFLEMLDYKWITDG